MTQMVLLLDFGAQYGQLIARRVREAGVYCEILPADTPARQVAERRPAGIILSGGPASVYGPEAPTMDRELLSAGVPVLGICYGMQLMAQVLGGRVEPGPGEYGRVELRVVEPDGLLRGVEERTPVWMSHGDRVLEPPPDFRVLAESSACPVAAMAAPERGLYAVQFHPEVAHTARGMEILKNFLFGVCHLAGDWSMEAFIPAAVDQIRRRMGEEGRAICALSGGVDSAVAAALVHRAVGDRLTAVFVDHGLLREGEGEEVVRTFREQLGVPLVHVEARDRFLAKLAGVADPEAKRRIIGTEFVRVFEEQAARLGRVDFLVQGTLYPDVIESGHGKAALIKTHHNVGGLPEDLALELVEPLRELFKDEVRRLGRELGLPEGIVRRQPFPGPGLAVRILGEVTPERLALLRRADRVVREEIEAAGWAERLWQYFAVLPEGRSVGVMGDGRSYGAAVVLRAVTSEDGMTADWARLPHELLDRIARRVVNEVPGVVRVVYDLTAKPPGTIEWE